MKTFNKVQSRDEVAGKLLNGSFTTALIIFGILVISKLIIPSNSAGWSIFPLVDYILISGFMLCFVCMLGIYTFQAWTKTKEEYYNWLVSLGLLRTSYSRFISGFYPKGMFLWVARLTPILIVLFVCLVVVLIRT
jgi:hypothetical protein